VFRRPADDARAVDDDVGARKTGDARADGILIADIDHKRPIGTKVLAAPRGLRLASVAR
jgi:hypothetical protein